MTLAGGILARGPWSEGEIRCSWSSEPYAPPAEREAAADAAIAALERRGSPAHDGMAARLAGFRVQDGRLELELEPMRWALRLVEDDVSSALSALCVVRDAHGRWLAGRRAAWLATWAGRWALGAAGAVEVEEDPVLTLGRELAEEWGVRAERLAAEALIRLPNGLVMLVGQAWLAPGAEVVRDAEHDEHAWWPPDVAAWPPEGDPGLRRVAALVGG